MTYKFGKLSNKRREGINPLLIELSDKALFLSKIDITVPWMGGLRTPEEQNAIFKEGNSRLDGYEKQSYHQSGNAIDLIPVDEGYSNIDGLLYFAQLMFLVWAEMKEEGKAKGYKLEWGGLWRGSWDKPHWQIKKI